MAARPETYAHIEAQRRLRLYTRRALERLWGETGTDREDVDRWLREAVPLIEASKKTSAALTQAYISRIIGRRLEPIDVERTLERDVRPGARTDEVYTRPFITLWTGLKEGSDYELANHAATARVGATAAMDVQMAMRATANAVAKANPAIQGYTRVANPGACEFCEEVDGAFLTSADAMPLHNHCGCGIEPQTDSQPQTAPPEGVAVQDHGELGPILADKGHEFTSL